MEASNMLLNNESPNKNIQEGIKRFLETNDNGNTTTQTSWDTK